MSNIQELSAANQFASRLEALMQQSCQLANHHEAGLSQAIADFVLYCVEMRRNIGQWGQRIFKGQVEFDSEVEAVLKTQAFRLLSQAQTIAARGRQAGACNSLPALHELHYFLADLDYLLEHWVSPQLSVSPAPRVNIPEATAREMMQRIEELRRKTWATPEISNPVIESAHAAQ